MELQTILTIIGGVLGTALGTGAIWKVRSEIRESDAYHKKRQEECDIATNLLRDRVACLEAATKQTLPEWQKNYKGSYLSVNEPFIRKVLIPLGLDGGDILGKTDEDIAEFSDELKKVLVVLDKQVRIHGWAVAVGVRFHDKTQPMVIIKRSYVNPLGMASFIGIAAPYTGLESLDGGGVMTG